MQELRQVILTRRLRPADRRLSVLSSAIGVLESLGGTSTVETLEIRKAIECGKEPDRKFVRSVESAFLVALMSPKLSEEERPEERGFLSVASGAFCRLTKPMPTRQHARRVYKEFEQAFARKPTG
jgi:hypothetical protein